MPISSGSHQPRSDLKLRLGVKFFCVFLTHFGILHEILGILSIDMLGKKKTIPPQETKKKKFGAFGANTFRQNVNLGKDGFENFGESWGEGGGGVGVWNSNRLPSSPPWRGNWQLAP